jgi:hypothetical protein
LTLFLCFLFQSYNYSLARTREKGRERRWDRDKERSQDDRRDRNRDRDRHRDRDRSRGLSGGRDRKNSWDADGGHSRPKGRFDRNQNQNQYENHEEFRDRYRDQKEGRRDLRRRRDDDHWYDEEEHDGYRDREQSRHINRDYNRDRGRDRDRSDSYYGEEESRRHEKRRRMPDVDFEESRGDRRPRFPAPFELSQIDYVLDPTTGYFYEEFSDFLHDPKSKLYFHHGSRRYYSFDLDDDRYIDVEEDYGKLKMKMSDERENEVDTGNDLIVQALQGSQKTEPAGGKQKISIMIKHKPKKGRKGEKKANGIKSKKEVITSEAKIQEQILKSQKEKVHNNDMEKWSKRNKELDAVETLDSKKLRFIHAYGKPISCKVKKTKSGKPVCLLCKRKFESVPQLELHVLKSALHKYHYDRLTANETEYVDRAQNRRSMYETDMQTIPLMDKAEVNEIMAPSLEKSRDIVSTHDVTPEDTLGNSNIGNKMLQILGWKEGHSLGKMSAVGSGSSKHLKKDWEKIESMAARKGRK